MAPPARAAEGEAVMCPRGMFCRKHGVPTMASVNPGRGPSFALLVQSGSIVAMAVWRVLLRSLGAVCTRRRIRANGASRLSRLQTAHRGRGRETVTTLDTKRRQVPMRTAMHAEHP